MRRSNVFMLALFLIGALLVAVGATSGMSRYIYVNVDFPGFFVVAVSLLAVAWMARKGGDDFAWLERIPVGVVALCTLVVTVIGTHLVHLGYAFSPDEFMPRLQAEIFWPTAIAGLAGLSPDETVRALDALVDKELVQRRPVSRIANEQEYSFRHILTHDVAYGLLPRGQRQRAHAEAARWLEIQLGDRTEESIEILAEHVRLSGDDARAVTYLHRAAAKAYRQYANADAIRLYGQAIDVAPRASTPDQEMAALHMGRGDVYQLLGAYPEALADFERGRAAAQKAGDAAREALLENRVGLIHHRQVRLDEAERHFTHAADLARAVGDQRTLARSLVDLVNVRWDRGLVGSEDPALREGIALLRRSDDLSGLARGLNLLCMVHFSAGDVEAALAAAQEALANARKAGDKSREATSLSYLSCVTLFWSRFDDSLTFGREAMALAEQIGDRRRVAFAMSFTGQALLSLGRWGEALRVLEDALPMVREFARFHMPFALAALATLYFELGAVERAQATIGQAPDVATHHPSWREALVTARLWQARLNGDAAAINARLNELQHLPTGLFVPDDGETILPAGEGFLEVGRHHDLRSFLDARRESVRKFSAPSQLAGLALIDARLALLDGDAKAARDAVDAALQHAQVNGDVITTRRGLEIRLQMLGQAEDRAALRALLLRLAMTLPEDVRETFLASPRAAVLRD